MRCVFATAWEVVREPVPLLLLSRVTIHLLLGNVREALMPLGFVFVVLGIKHYQVRQTEQALEALSDLSDPGRSSSGATCWPKGTEFAPMPSF